MKIAFTPPVNVSKNPGLSVSPAIAVSIPASTISLGDPGSLGHRPVPSHGGSAHPYPPFPAGPSVYVVWADKPASSSDYNIFFSASHDGGISFSTPKNLSNLPYWSSFPQIAVSGNDVYVVWKRHTIIGGGDGEIFFVRSTDKGATFSAPLNLSNNSADSVHPRLAVAGDNLYVVWTDVHPAGAADIPLRRSADRGATFNPTTTLASNGWVYSLPRIAASGSDVYVVWNDKNKDISLCRSTNSGAAFSAPANLSNNPAWSWSPEVSVQGNDVYVAWFDVAPGLQNVSFTRSGNKAVSFSAPISVSPNSQNATDVGVNAASPNVYVVWDDLSGGQRQAFFARSTNNGASFGSPVNLSKSTADIYAPLMSPEGAEVYVAWAIRTGYVGGGSGGVPNFDIVCAASADGGATFSSPTNLTLTPNNRSVSVTTVVAGGVAYIAWSEGSLADADILFSTARLYEPLPTADIERIERRPIPDLPYKVDLFPYKPPLPPPGPPPPVKRLRRLLRRP